MVLSFQFTVLSFEFRRPTPVPSGPCDCPILRRLSFFYCRSAADAAALYLLLLLFIFCYFSGNWRFESIVGCGVDSGLSLAAWLSDLGFRFRSSVAFPAPPRTQLKILNCLARLTVCNWSLALGSAYQLTNLPANRLPQVTSLPPEAWTCIAWLRLAFIRSWLFRLSPGCLTWRSPSSILQLIWQAGLVWSGPLCSALPWSGKVFGTLNGQL